MTNAERITRFLHLTRCGVSLSQDQLGDVAQTLADTSPQDAAHALGAYLRDLLNSSAEVLQVEHQALTHAKEFKDNGGVLH